MADEKAATNFCPLAFVSVITESPKNWSFYILLIPLGLKVAARSDNYLNFFLFPFCTKSLICLKGKSITPLRGNTIILRSSQQLPRLRLRPLKSFFELTRSPSRALDLPCALLPELQRYKDTSRCAALGVEVPGHRQKQLTQT